MDSRTRKFAKLQQEALKQGQRDGFPDAGVGCLSCFGCDCGRILESLSILPHRQGAQALRQFLAEGELTAAPSGCESVYAESLGFLAFRNRNKKTGQTHSPGVRAATFPICPRSHPPQHQKKTRHAPSLSACLVPSFILSSPAPIFLNSPSSHPRPSTKCSL